MLSDEQQQDLAGRFERFAAETAGDSPLYATLARGLAAQPTALELLAQAPARQRRPNLLLAAVHDLVLAGLSHPLSAYYPSVGGDRPADDGAVRAFVDVLEEQRHGVLRRVTTRTTQTNEVGRCAALWPALHHLAARDGRPLALVELGASAGLLLHLDRYAYDLGGPAGAPHAPVRLAPELRGRTPDLDGHVRVASRTGLDLAPLDATDPGDARWLAACVWPENTERHARLHGALQVARAHADLDLRRGDVVTTLPSTLARASDDDVLPCAFHSAALAYLRREERDTVAEALAAAGRVRDLGWLSLEGPFLAPFVDLDPPSRPDEPYLLLGLTTWTAGDRRDELLARVHPHGRWLEWLTG